MLHRTAPVLPPSGDSAITKNPSKLFDGHFTLRNAGTRECALAEMDGATCDVVTRQRYPVSLPADLPVPNAVSSSTQMLGCLCLEQDNKTKTKTKAKHSTTEPPARLVPNDQLDRLAKTNFRFRMSSWSLLSLAHVLWLVDLIFPKCVMVKNRSSWNLSRNSA